MKSLARWWVLVLLAAVLSPALPTMAQDYPDHPITIVVPYVPGGVTDALSRYLALKLGGRLGGQVIVQNKPGGGGSIGVDFVAHSKPDGYTLLVTIESLDIMPVLYPKRPYDPLKILSPVTLLVTAPQVIVANPTFGPRTVSELVSLAKAHPNQLSYASSGIGTAMQLGMELLQSMADIKLRNIPYKGGGQAVFDLVAGQVKLGIIGLAPALPYIRSGRLRALAVTGDKRSPLLPGVPTVAESGLPGFQSLNWFGLFSPAHTPTLVIDRLHDEVVQIMHDPASASYFAKLGVEIVTSPHPADFAGFIRHDMAKWQAIVKKNHLEME